MPLPSVELLTTSRLYRIPHHNAIALSTKFLHFLSLDFARNTLNLSKGEVPNATTQYETVIADALGTWIPGSGAGNRNHR